MRGQILSLLKLQLYKQRCISGICLLFSIETHIFFQASALLSNPSELRSLTDPSLLPDTNLATLNKTSQSVAQVLAYTTASESQHLLCLPRVISPCSQPGCFSRVLEICFVMTKTSNCRYFILHPPLPPPPPKQKEKRTLQYLEN